MNKFDNNMVLLERAASGDKNAEEQLVRENMGLVKSIALRFLGRGQELDDLMQIGAIGMLKAVRGYDKSYNTVFSTYAVPMITGEIKRFLRDDGIIKVSREAKRNYLRLMKEKERYILKTGNEPKLNELCALCEITCEDAVYAMEACSGTVSLQEKIGGEDGLSVEDLCGEDSLGDMIEKMALGEAIESLDEKARDIIYMRYFKGMTQSDVAKRLGITQVKVSRTEKKIIMSLKEKLKCG